MEIIIILIRLGVIISLVNVGIGLLKQPKGSVLSKDTPVQIVIGMCFNKLSGSIYLCTAALCAFI